MSGILSSSSWQESEYVSQNLKPFVKGTAVQNSDWEEKQYLNFKAKCDKDLDVSSLLKTFWLVAKAQVLLTV